MDSSREALLRGFGVRVDRLALKIEAIEENSARAVAQSEEAVTDAQAAQFELRKQFGRVFEGGMNGLNRKVQGLKARVLELRSGRARQIEAVRAQLIGWSEDARRVQTESIERKQRVSLQPEIRKLKRELHELKRQLRRKFGQK
jgi:hypothetical protein